ncbi:substrate-binding domain-containing protein [Microbacterium sp. 2FI]|uniref:substrate-binding domain-containing protein n=1 Tax=Microbacterium sp. 2FI TaxID=2502193 RepID=UPI00201833A4|nr:substrate-binding domain-containing protein [Microbacterium sp. 2FI]
MLVDRHAADSYAAYAEGAMHRAAAGGFTLLLHPPTALDTQSQARMSQLLDANRFAGALAALGDGAPPLSAAPSPAPIIAVGIERDTSSGCSVVVDEELGGLIAGRHLLNLGCRRLLVAGGGVSPRASARAAGIRRAVQEFTNAEWVNDWAAKLNSTGEQSQSAQIREPDGLIVMRLDSGGTTKDALPMSTGKSRNLPTVAFDDRALSNDALPQVVHILPAAEQMGSTAVDLLLQELDDPLHDHVVVAVCPELLEG